MALKKPKHTSAKSLKVQTEDDAEQESQAMLWLMQAAKNWCNSPSSRNERTLRKKKLGEIMQVEVQSVKNFYNQGQIKSKYVFPVLEAVTGVPQEELVFVLENHSFFKDKLGKLPTERRRLLSLIARLTDNEVYVLNRLIEAGLEANKAISAESDE